MTERDLADASGDSTANRGTRRPGRVVADGGLPGESVAPEAPDEDASDGPPPSRYADRIERLARAARETREGFRVADDPDGEAARQRALEVARDGLGPVVACYVEARTSDDPPRFSAREHRLLRRATRDWLECFARCHGVAHESDATVRIAAELLFETHDVVAVAELLTDVPGR